MNLKIQADHGQRTVASQEGHAGAALGKEHRRVILVLIVGVFLPLLDATAVNIALGQISIELAASLASLQWVATAYTLAAAGVVPLSAWAANRLGAKRMWIAGLGIFLAGSISSALAWSASSRFGYSKGLVQGC